MNTNTKPVAIVTGASSGIGVAIGKRLHEGGHNVVLMARRQPLLEQLCEELGDGAMPSAVDLTVPADVAAAIAEITQTHPTIDVLVNCAGARPERILTTNNFEDNVALWSEQMDVNLTSAAYVSFAVAPHLRRPGSSIINIGSVAAQTGGRRPGSAGYAAAKAGLHGFSLALSRELAPEGIRVNTVAPGFVAATGFTGAWGEEITQPLITDTPAGRAGTPDDIAGAAVFLASSDASFITGQSIAVNGGMVTN